MPTKQTERFIRVPFPVLFMKVFDNENDARKLLEIATKFLIAKRHNILHAQIVESEFGGDKRFTLSVAYSGRAFGVSLHKHTGFQLVHRWDPYANNVPTDDYVSRYAGEYFMWHWRVRVPLRLAPIEIEDSAVVDQEDAA